MIDVGATERLPRLGAARASRVAAVTAVLRPHAALVALLAAGFVLRAIAEYAIYPGIWFSDSNGYITTAATGTLNPTRVSAYSLFVAPFWHLGSAAALIIVQHLIGLAMVVLLYALLRRRGVSRLLATCAVVPAALDAYLIQIEHTIMSETIFHATLVAAIALLLWKDRPGVVATAVAGLLLGYAGVVRSVAVPIVAVFVVYLLARRVGWRGVVLLVLGWAVVTAGYAGLYDAQHRKFGLTQSGGRFLYGKVAPFADCSRLTGVPRDERFLCPDPRHPYTTTSAMWGKRSPLRGLPGSADRKIRDFAMRVVRERPVKYASVVALDFLHYFEPGHRIGPNDPQISQWEFPADPNTWGIPGYRGPIRPGGEHHAFEPNEYVGHMVGRPHTNVPASKLLHVYQRFAFTSGQVLGLCVLVVLVALFLRRGALRLRLDAALLTFAVLAMLLVATALSVFSYRYGLIAVMLLPAAAALAATAMLERRRETSPS